MSEDKGDAPQDAGEEGPRPSSQQVRFSDAFVGEDLEVEHSGGGETAAAGAARMFSSAAPADDRSRAISIKRVQEDLPLVSDHFSLARPGSKVRFRRSNVRVYEQKSSQIILHETAKRRAGGQTDLTITVKQMKTSGYSLNALRAVYSFVAVFAAGFAFIFCLALLMYLFLDLATEAGATSHKESSAVAFIGVLLSIPVFVYALSAGMTIATRFIADTWAGHPFLRTFGNWSSVVTDWAAFIMYLGNPIITMCITLFAKKDDWWAISMLTWFASVFIFYGFFAACCTFYEINATMYLVEDLHPDLDASEMTLLSKMKLSILNTQKYRLSGVKEEMYMIDGSLEAPESGSFHDSDLTPQSTFTGLYSRLTFWDGLSCIYTKLDPPQRSWGLDEARGLSPFVTRDSWSLEKLYCRDRRANYILVVSGESAVTRSQGKSSFACAILGNALALLVFIGLLVWMGSGAAFVIIVIVIILLCCIPSMRSSIRLMQTYQDITRNKTKEDAEEDASIEEDGATMTTRSSALYQVHETFRYSAPTDRFSWIVFGLEIIFFFLWPLIHLCTTKNAAQAILFCLLGIISGARFYLNPAVFIKELGNFGSLGKEQVEDEETLPPDLADAKSKREWEAKSRLSDIVGSIASGKSLRFWNIVFGLLVVFFCLVVIVAVAQGDLYSDPTSSFMTANERMVLVDDFEYEAQPHLPYPNCKLKKGLEVQIEALNGTVRSTGMNDVAFLSNLAYVLPGGNTSLLLNQWFGNGNAVEESDIVNGFKSSDIEYTDSAVSYKLITFPYVPGFAVVAIRGTATVWDLMADAQLWLAAGLFQGLREILPIGSIWTPILHKVVKFVNALESESLNRVSFYKETTKFVQFLKKSGNYKLIQITGHSLGGGLALITGSQTNISAIGLSAPNAMLSRDTFEPKLTVEQLNTLTFNIVPNRDVVPMLDDKANLYQNIECRAAANNFAGCHTGVRSLCEIIYTCGSKELPVICQCGEYGYPEPLPTGERTNFTQACLDAGYKPPG